jgi:steroid 5-alpha reductase family enzyme
MDRGLWGWTRHPNYFGDACVAWGLWLAGGLASGWLPGLLTVVAPAAMTYFLVFATGARLLERTMMQREGYPAYAARTSMFLPLPPRRPRPR